MLTPGRKNFTNLPKSQSPNFLTMGLSEIALENYKILSRAGIIAMSGGTNDGLRFLSGKGYSLTNPDIDPVDFERRIYQDLITSYITNKIDIEHFVSVMQDAAQTFWQNNFTSDTWRTETNPLNGRVNENWFAHLASPDYKFRPEHVIPLLITSDLLPANGVSLSNRLGLTRDSVRELFLDQIKIPLLPNGSFWYSWIVKGTLVEHYRHRVAGQLNSTQDIDEQSLNINNLFSLPHLLNWLTLQTGELAPSNENTSMGKKGAAENSNSMNSKGLLLSNIPIAQMHRAVDILELLWSGRAVMQGHKCDEVGNIAWRLEADTPEAFSQMLSILGTAMPNDLGSTLYSLDDLPGFFSRSAAAISGSSRRMSSAQVQRIGDAFGIPVSDLEKIMDEPPNNATEQDAGILGYLFSDTLHFVSLTDRTVICFPMAETYRTKTLKLVLSGVYQKITLEPNNTLVVTRHDNRQFILPNHPWSTDKKLPTSMALVPTAMKTIDPVWDIFPPNQRTLLTLARRQANLHGDHKSGFDLLRVPLPEPLPIIKSMSSKHANKIRKIEEDVLFASSILQDSIEFLPLLSPDEQTIACNLLQAVFNSSRGLTTRLAHVTRTLEPQLQSLTEILEPFIDRTEAPVATNNHVTLGEFFLTVDAVEEFIRTTHQNAEIKRERQKQIDILKASIAEFGEQIGCILDQLHSGRGLGPVEATVLKGLSPHARKLWDCGVTGFAGRILNPYGEGDESLAQEFTVVDNDVTRLREIERLFKEIDDELRKLAESSGSAGLRTVIQDVGTRNSKKRRSAERSIERAERIQEDVMYCREAMHTLDVTVTAMAAFMEDYFGRKALPSSRVKEILRPTDTNTDVAASEVRKILHIISDVQIGRLIVADYGHNNREIVYNPAYHEDSAQEASQRLSLNGYSYNLSLDPFNQDLVYIELNGITRVVNTANGIPHTEAERLAVLDQLQRQLLPVFNGLGAILDIGDQDNIQGVIRNIAGNPTLFEPAIIHLANGLLEDFDEDTAPDMQHRALVLGLQEIRAELRRQAIGAKPLSIIDISTLVNPSTCAQKKLDKFLPIQGDRELQTKETIFLFLDYARDCMRTYHISARAIGHHLERLYGRRDIPSSGYETILASNTGASLDRQATVLGRVLTVLADLEKETLRLGHHHNGNQEILFPPSYLDLQGLKAQPINLGAQNLRLAVRPQDSASPSVCLFAEYHGNVQAVNFPMTPTQRAPQLVRPIASDLIIG